MEYRFQGAEENVGAISGQMNSIKMMTGTFWLGSITILMGRYGRRISTQLSGGKEASPQLLKIRKMCRITSVLCSMGTLTKFMGIFVRQFLVCQDVTPCGSGAPTIMIPIFIYITQYGITLINQPQRGGKVSDGRYWPLMFITNPNNSFGGRRK